MPSKASEPAKPLRILLAEDDAIIGMLLADVLKDMGHAICAIEATETATVITAAQCRPDLLIIDAHLGPGSGVTAVEHILRIGFVPHLFVSGDPASVLTYMPDAVVIQKPFREADLSRAIERALAVPAAAP
jgi:two-component system, response regulator PdtaR